MTQRLQNLLTRLMSTVSVDRVEDRNFDGNFVVKSSNGLNKRTRVYKYLPNELESRVFIQREIILPAIQDLFLNCNAQLLLLRY